MNPQPISKVAQREATVEKLITVARLLFTTRGYAETSTEDIVRAAQVTRGALYHHFKDKRDLFTAVLERVQARIAERIEQATSHTTDPETELRLGCRAFLECSLEPDVQRIALIDAPAVVGWSVWRKLDAAHAQQGLGTALRALQVTPLEAVMYLLSGAMNEAVLWIAQSDDPAQSLEDADRSLQKIISSLISRT